MTPRPPPDELVQRGLRERWYYRRDARALGLDVGYGLGWIISADGSYSHAGLTGTYALVDPTQELIVVMMTHSNDARMPGIEFVALVRAAILERR